MRAGPTGAAVQLHRQDSTSKSEKLVLRGAAASPVETPPAPHQSPVFCKMSLSAPLAASALIIREKTEHGSDIIALDDTVFALRAGRLH